MSQNISEKQPLPAERRRCLREYPLRGEHKKERRTNVLNQNLVVLFYNNLIGNILIIETAIAFSASYSHTTLMLM
jgi:hypothetical protein